MSLTPILLQNTSSSITFYLSTVAGAPATGIAYSAVTAGLKKEGEATFSAFAVTALNWHEISNGYYYLDVSSSNTNIIGNLYLNLSITNVNPALLIAYVATTPSVPVTPVPTVPGTASLFGFILDAQGSPVPNAAVSFKVLGAPVTVTGSGYTTSPVVVKSDSTGYFSVSLVEGLTVDVICAAVNYRRTLTVPSADSNLFLVP